MGMDLSGRGGYFRFNNWHWRHILLLANRYGWRPAGTEWTNFRYPELDGTEDWDGDYFSNDGQWVTDEDAANIAQALERALEDIPDEDTVGGLAASQSSRFGGVEVIEKYSELEEYLTPPHLFSDEYRQYVREFIDYCRVGGFYIT